MSEKEGHSNGHQFATVGDIARLDEKIDTETRIARQDLNEFLVSSSRLEALINRYDATVVMVHDKLYALKSDLMTRWNKAEQRATRQERMTEMILKHLGIPVPP